MTLRELAYKIYWRMEQTLVPGLRNSQYWYKEKLESLVPVGGNWLDVGCGRKVFPEWMSSAVKSEERLVGCTNLTVGLDFGIHNLRLHRSIQTRAAGDIAHAPFKESTFDLISANMVMEHVVDPVNTLNEIWRILRPGGIFLFHTINIRNYAFITASVVPEFLKLRIISLLEGRDELDVFPTVYRYNTSDQIAATAKRCGFTVLAIELLNSTPSTAVLGPFAMPELLVTRLLQSHAGEKYRSNIIAAIQKPCLS